MNIKRLAKKIRTARKQRGLIQRDVAKKVGICYPSYVFLEQGKRYPKYDKMIALGKLLKLPISQIA